MSRTAQDVTGRGRWIMVGAVGGLLGAVLMAMYAMVVSAAYKDVGFFTPLYHIGSAFASPDAMMTSMEEAAAGNGFYFTAGPASVGLLVHMATGAAAGALFGVIASLATWSRVTTVAAGVVYGMIVLIGNAFVTLPIVAELFDGGDAIADMPAMAGWGTFVVEHVIFGVVLGALVALWAAKRHQPRSAAHASSRTASHPNLGREGSREA